MRNSLRLMIAMLAAVVLFAGACSDGSDNEDSTSTDDGSEASEQSSGGGGGDGPVKIAFSTPGADHGWTAAITTNAEAEAEKWDDIEFTLLEGSNDSAGQVAQVEQLIADDPDVLVILPQEGDPLTPVAQEAMSKGIPVVNIDRAFSDPAAYRTWIGGDNHGIGVSAGNYFAEQLDCSGKVVEIQGLAGISVTEERSAGFAEALEDRCGTGIEIVAKQPADFNPDKGLTVMETILQAQPEIDAVYTHDDDMAAGVVSAIENADRADEMFLTGAGGSKAAMEQIKAGGLYKATFMYNPSMAASAVRLARLIGLNQGMSDLAEPQVPSYITLPASTVTQDNVDDYMSLGF